MLVEEFENALSDLVKSVSNLMRDVPESPTKIEAAYIEYNVLFIKLSNKQTICLHLPDEEIMQYVTIIPELVNANVTKLIINKENKYFEINYTNFYFGCSNYISFNFNTTETYEINNSRK